MAKENKNTGNVPHRGKSSKPQLRFPGFEGVWEKCGIGEIISIKSDKYNPAIDKEEYPCIELESLSQGSGELLSTFNSKHQKSTKNVFHSGNVLFGKLRPYLKKYFLADFDGVCSSEIWVMKSHILNSSYLYAFVQSSYFMSLAEISSGSKMPRADWNLVSASTINYPKDLNEREKIGALFDLISQRIRTQSKTIEALKTLKTAFAKKIFIQHLRFKDENGNNFPEWKTEKLGSISIITTGSSNREDSILDGEFIFFDRSQDIRTSNKYLFDKEAIIVPGEGQEFIPKYFNGKFDLHQRTYAIFDFVNVIGRYLYYHMLNDDRHLQSQAVGSTVKSLRLPMFQSMHIKLPCIEEQQKIANFLSSIDSKIDTETHLLQKLEEQKKYLLQNLFV